MVAYKYQGAGNDFIIFDNRQGDIDLTDSQIRFLCDRRYGIGGDGLMLLNSPKGENRDFEMKFYNADGFEGDMCGNGARCLVAFAAHRGLKSYRFDARDGYHEGFVLEYGKRCIIRVKIKDVNTIYKYQDKGYFANTGVDHLVLFTQELDKLDIKKEGPYWRYHPDFEGGVNVNFIEEKEDGLHIRTWEKGVEDETYACGTGATASAVSAYREGKRCCTISEDGTITYTIKTLKDTLKVDFKEDLTDVYLTGPATYVFETDITL